MAKGFHSSHPQTKHESVITVLLLAATVNLAFATTQLVDFVECRCLG